MSYPVLLCGGRGVVLDAGMYRGNYEIGTIGAGLTGNIYNNLTIRTKINPPGILDYLCYPSLD